MSTNVYLYNDLDDLGLAHFGKPPYGVQHTMGEWETLSEGHMQTVQVTVWRNLHVPGDVILTQT